jgi:hypothetical protein
MVLAVKEIEPFIGLMTTPLAKSGALELKGMVRLLKHLSSNSEWLDFLL